MLCALLGSCFGTLWVYQQCHELVLGVISASFERSCRGNITASQCELMFLVDRECDAENESIKIKNVF